MCMILSLFLWKCLSGKIGSSFFLKTLLSAHKRQLFALQKKKSVEMRILNTFWRRRRSLLNLISRHCFGILPETYMKSTNKKFNWIIYSSIMLKKLEIHVSHGFSAQIFFVGLLLCSFLTYFYETSYLISCLVPWYICTAIQHHKTSLSLTHPVLIFMDVTPHSLWYCICLLAAPYEPQTIH